MLISPPFLPPRANNQTEDDWLNAAMTGDSPGRGAFPVSFNLGWHGGIHLNAPALGNGFEPVRAIADGTVVFTHLPTEGLPNLPPEHPLMYNGATSDGVVVIRHETEIGEGNNATVTFFSIYMHLHEIPNTIKPSCRVYRKDMIGRVGYLNGDRGRMHFEIICDDTNLARLVGRATGELPSTANGRTDAVYGEIYFHLPGATQIFAQKPLHTSATAMMQPPRPPHTPASHPLPPLQALPVAHTTTTGLIVGVHYAGGEGAAGNRGDATVITYEINGSTVGTALEENEAEYNLYTNATAISDAYPANNRPAPSAVYELLRFGRIIGPDALTPADVPHWRQIRYPGGQGWVNLNATTVHKFSDADFPHWKQWKLVDDSADQDSRCDSAMIKGWLDVNGDDRVEPREATARLNDAKIAPKLAKVIAKFPTEWDSSTIDVRWGWLKTRTADNPNPLSNTDFQELRAHIAALAFWPGGTGISGNHWHWQPREFIRHFRKCGWLSEKELARIYPDSKYPVRALQTEGRQRTPTTIRNQYRTAINKVMRKYFINTPVRMTHFLGEGAVESMYLTLMVEGSVSFSRNPGHASFQPEDDGFYVPNSLNDYLYYLVGRLGNIERLDAPKFRGRGMKQLTGMENYSKYWVYRGWLAPTSFQSPWWNPSRPDRAPDIPDPQRLSTDAYNAIDAGGWYWTAGSQRARFRTINSIITTGGISRQTVEMVATSINGTNRTTGEPNQLDDRLAESLSVKNICMDDT